MASLSDVTTFAQSAAMDVEDTDGMIAVFAQFQEALNTADSVQATYEQDGTVLSAATAIRSFIPRSNGQRSAPTIGVSFGFVSEDKMIVIPALLFEDPKNINKEIPNYREIMDALTEIEGMPEGPAKDTHCVQTMVACNMNVNPKDIGALLKPDMRLSRGAWQNLSIIPDERFDVKLESATISMIAALNAHHVPGADGKILVWCPAYAIAMGMLPDEDSFVKPINGKKLTREFKLTSSVPSDEMMSTVLSSFTEYGHLIVSLSFNLVAVFGAQHLHYDHTYMARNTDMLRANRASVKTLATIPGMTDELGSIILKYAEFSMRNAFHFLGLGGPYTVFRFGNRHEITTLALRVRDGVTPPTVQKAEVVLAGVTEMVALPQLQGVRAAFANTLAVAHKISQVTKESPPSYSDLFYLYGVDTKLVHGENDIALVSTLLPLVAGYAHIFCIADDDNGQEQFVGLALSHALVNAKRDHPSLVGMYMNIFDSILQSASKSTVSESVAMLTDRLAPASDA